MLYLHNSVNFFCCCYYTVRLNPNRHFLAVPNRSGMLYWLYKNEKSHWDIPGTERTKDPYFLVDCEANTNIVLNQILTVRIPKFFPVILVFLFCFRIFWMCPKIFCPTQTIVYGCCGELNFSVRLLTPPPPTPSCFPNPVFLVHFRSFFLWGVHFSRRFPCCLQNRRSMR